MNESLARKRCFHHGEREAAARCPECQRFYCRECVTEHEGRVLCVSCLARSAPEAKPLETARFGAVLLLLQASAALAILWFVFFSLGRAVLSVPSEFHESVVEQSYALEEE